MKARVISYSLAEPQAMEDLLNDWLKEVGDIQIEEFITLGTTDAGEVGDAEGALVILYGEQDKEAPVQPEQTKAQCSQCKKKPAMKGLKMCNGCREYQREYREKQKKEKKKARYP